MENDKIKIPEPPDYFGEYERGLFIRCCKALEELGSLHKADFDMLKNYCFQMGICHKLEPEIALEGPVVMYVNNKGAANPRVNPKQIIYNQTMTLTSRIAQYFGFTPQARKKMSLQVEKKTGEFDGI